MSSLATQKALKSLNVKTIDQTVTHKVYLRKLWNFQSKTALYLVRMSLFLSHKENWDIKDCAEKLVINAVTLFSKEMNLLSQSMIRFAVTQSDLTVQSLAQSALHNLQNVRLDVHYAKRRPICWNFWFLARSPLDVLIKRKAVKSGDVSIKSIVAWWISTVLKHVKHVETTSY